MFQVLVVLRSFAAKEGEFGIWKKEGAIYTTVLLAVLHPVLVVIFVPLIKRPPCLWSLVHYSPFFKHWED